MIVQIFKRHCVIWYYTMVKSVTQIFRKIKYIDMCVCVLRNMSLDTNTFDNDIQRERYGNFDLSIVVENHFRLERVRRMVWLFILNVDCIGIFIKIVCIVALHYYGNGKWEQPLPPQQIHLSMPATSTRYTGEKKSDQNLFENNKCVNTFVVLSSSQFFFFRSIIL